MRGNNEHQVMYSNYDDVKANETVGMKQLIIDPYAFKIEMNDTTNETMLNITDEILQKFKETVQEIVCQKEGATVEWSKFPHYATRQRPVLDAQVYLENRVLKNFEVEVDVHPTTLQVVAYDEDDAQDVIYNSDLSYHIDLGDVSADEVRTSDEDFTSHGRGIV